MRVRNVPADSLLRAGEEEARALDNSLPAPKLTTNKVFLDHTLQAFVAPDRPQSLLRHPQFSAADAAAAPAQLAALVA